jgi:alkanesulfonate monooxygenase SsuD/methylene tetrahydromethanopterin reductase-like flavin-dependent oxidoreductase (luciferase family)
VGIVLREQDLTAWSGRLRELAERAVAAGIDHLTVGDHVSFAGGHGADGLIQAAALLSAHPSISVQIVRLFMTGEEVDFRGRFFELHGAIRPAPAPPIPILVGGRSDAALVRAGRLGDGWLALWISPRRFEEAVQRIEAAAGEAGRSSVGWQHALQLWAGFGESRGAARQRLSGVMKAAYGLPFERFARYAPCGPPAAIAEASGRMQLSAAGGGDAA